MNALTLLTNHPLARDVGWTLLHFVWQGAVFAALFALIQSLLRRASPNARYLAGCLALGLMLAAPMATLIFLRSARPSAEATSSTITELPHPAVVGNRLAHNDSPALANWPRTAVTLVTAAVQVTAPWLTPLWLTGVLLLSVRLARGCWDVRKLRFRETELLETHWTNRLEQLKARLGISRPVRLLKSTLVEVPSVIGWLRPVILLPASSLTGLSPAQLESILAHELAHIRRHDYLVNAFQTVVEILLFYHPTVWWISRCVREERENCCDDLAIQVCGNRVAYARALAALEELREPPAQLAFAASGGSLLQRIRRLLGLAPDVRPGNGRHYSGIALLLIGLVLIGTGLSSLLAPTQYQAVARVSVERNGAENPGSAERPDFGGYDPYFIQTQFEIIQSELILGQVIDRLDLSNEWGRKYQGGEKLHPSKTIGLLRKRLSLRPVRNTSLIEIRSLSESPDEAARIANAIAETYRDQRLERRQQHSLRGLKTLENRATEDDEKIRKVQKDLDQLRLSIGISEADAHGLAPSPSFEAETARRIQATLIESRRLLIGRQEMLEKLKALKREDLREVLPRTVPDQNLTALITQLNSAEQRALALKNDVDESHPDFVRARDLVNDLKAKIENSVSGFMAALEVQVASAKAEVDQLEKTVEEAKRTDIEKAEKSRPYYDKKRELEQLLNLRRILEMKIASEKFDVGLPHSSPVEIIDRAVPALRPVSPNYPRGLSALFLGLMASGAGLCLLTRGPKLPTEAKAD